MGIPKAQEQKRLTVTVPEVVQALGISRPTVYKLLASGEIKATRVGRRRWIIPRSEVDRLAGL